MDSPDRIALALDGLREREIDTLDNVCINLWSDYADQPLTTAQRLTALSEIRKTVELRALLLGLIAPGERDH